jgi:hypothetical protein
MWVKEKCLLMRLKKLTRRQKEATALMFVGASIGLVGTALSKSAAVVVGMFCAVISIVLWLLPASPEPPVASVGSNWKELAARFRDLPRLVSAEWYSEGLDFDGKLHGEFWVIRGYLERISQAELAQAEALCRLAGTMLMRSPTLPLTLSDKVRTRSDDGDRWLYLLKERCGLSSTMTGSSSSYGTTIQTSSGIIEQLGEISASICVWCAAKELVPSSPVS